MEFENQFSQLAALLGDKSRSLMLWSLLDGRAYTATELSLCADISSQAASNHLAKLVDAQILMVVKQGRHRYFSYANSEVAQVIESMASLLPVSSVPKKKEKHAPVGITYARTCYDHIAGKLGVTITDALLEKGIIAVSGKCYEVTSQGYQWFASVGLSVEEIKLQKRSFAHQCLDWSERRHHVGGAIGAALLQMMLQNDWLRKTRHSRQLQITPKGTMELRNRLSIKM